MLKFSIKVEGNNISDIVEALDDIRKSILKGDVQGCADSGKYSFNSLETNDEFSLSSWEKEVTTGVCLYFKEFINNDGKKECVIIGNEQITVREPDDCWENEPIEYIDVNNIYSCTRFSNIILKEIDALYNQIN